jgi:sarcosine oxidase
MGSAAAWALARRGREVTLLEQFGPGHRNGASHGATRNLNLAYSAPDYVAMLAETVRLWTELEADCGDQLLARTGVVNHGTDRGLGGVRRALRAAGLRAEFLSAEEAAERWRGIRFDQQVLHMPDGGQLNPDRALPALQRLAAGNGAVVRHHVRVVELAVLDGGVRLTVEEDGRTEVFSGPSWSGLASPATASSSRRSSDASSPTSPPAQELRRPYSPQKQRGLPAGPNRRPSRARNDPALRFAPVGCDCPGHGPGICTYWGPS